jgi:fluoroacetyl-CoA thioesterase
MLMAEGANPPVARGPQWSAGLVLVQPVARLALGDGSWPVVAIRELLRSDELGGLRRISRLEWSGPAAGAESGASVELEVVGVRPGGAGTTRLACRLRLRDAAGQVHDAGIAELVVATDPPTLHPGVSRSFLPGAAVTKDYGVEHPWLTDHVDSRLVLATPALIGFFEDAAATLANPELEDGYAIVGATIEMRHLAPSYPGEQVSITATLEARRGPRLRYAVEGRVGSRIVGAGHVEQAVVKSASFGRTDIPENAA